MAFRIGDRVYPIRPKDVDEIVRQKYSAEDLVGIVVEVRREDELVAVRWLNANRTELAPIILRYSWYSEDDLTFDYFYFLSIYEAHRLWAEDYDGED